MSRALLSRREVFGAVVLLPVLAGLGFIGCARLFAWAAGATFGPGLSLMLAFGATAAAAFACACGFSSLSETADERRAKREAEPETREEDEDDPSDLQRSNSAVLAALHLLDRAEPAVMAARDLLRHNADRILGRTPEVPR